MTDHLKHVRQVLLRLREANLRANAKKCIVNKQEIFYLGFIITGVDIKTSPDNITSALERPIPKNKSELMSFVGRCSYHRELVENFAIIAKPLHQLTEGKVPFIWSIAANTAFENLKKNLTSSPILALPLVFGTFIFDTDASNFGIGAALSQIQLGEGKFIAYFSKVVNKVR